MTLPTPLTASVVLDGNLADMMFIGLKRGVLEDGRLEHLTADRSTMALARTVEPVGPDSAHLRFHLRRDARWSDGHPVSAGDVVFTHRLARAPEIEFPAQNYLAQIDSVVAEDDSTVSFQVSRRYPQILSHAAISTLPEHQFGDVPAAEFRRAPAIVNSSGGALLASGPFVIKSWTREREVTLAPNPHFQPRPRLDDRHPHHPRRGYAPGGAGNRWGGLRHGRRAGAGEGAHCPAPQNAGYA